MDKQAYNLSVIVVSDYGDPNQKSWRDERNVLHALTQQDIGEQFEVLLVDNVSLQHKVPPDLFNILPTLKIAFFDSCQSGQLINHALGQSSGNLVALIEADCIPAPDWLRLLVEVMIKNPDVSTASGRTTYGGSSIIVRCLSLLHRGFSDPGASGPTIHISNNGTLYRREVLEQFPYPKAITPFLSCWMRNNEMQRNAHLFYFERRAEMIHAFSGWKFVFDFHRNTGYSAMMIYQEVRYSKILKLLFQSLAIKCSSCFRLGKNYLYWYDWPSILVLLFILPLLEIPGMIDAIRGTDKIPHTVYH